jgi:hypothetical protein
VYVPGLAERNVSAGIEQRVLGSVETDDAFVAGVIFVLGLHLLLLHGIHNGLCLVLCWNVAPAMGVERLRLLWLRMRLDGGRAVSADRRVGLPVVAARVRHARRVLEQQLVIGVEHVAAMAAKATSLSRLRV